MDNRPRSSSNRYYRPELDVLRFVAFFLVFLNHSLPDGPDSRIAGLLGSRAQLFYDAVTTCSFGLSLFFTLSAFLICELLLREKNASGAVAVKHFYLRRILRIWPLYYFGIAIGVLTALLPGGESSSIGRLGWFAIFLGAWDVARTGWLNNAMAPLWSISVEEQFYLIAPWIVKFATRKMLIAFSAAVIVLSNCRLFFLGRELAANHRVWANSLVQFECFAAGILLSILLGGRLPKLAAWQRLALIAISLGCWWYAIHGLHTQFDSDKDNPGSWPLIAGYALAALGSVTMLVAFLGTSAKMPRWAVYLGRISYGLYVFHGLALMAVFALFPVGGPYRALLYIMKLGSTLALTALLAAISYRYLESPFLRLKKRYAVIASGDAQTDSDGVAHSS